MRAIDVGRDFPELSIEDRRLYGVNMIRRATRGRVPDGVIWQNMHTGAADSAIKNLSSKGPAFVDLLCSPGGDIWLNRFALTDSTVGRSATWDLFEKSGQHLVVKFPDAFRLFDVADTLGAGASADSLGILTLKTTDLGALLGQR